MEGSNVDEGFREGEEDMVEEGHAFLPAEMHDNDEMERALFLKNSLQRSGFMHEVIECRPMVSAEVLGIQGDDELGDLGVPTEGIRNMREFEAVVAAVTAKFYANDRFEEKGFIVPKRLDDTDEA
jgi:predicted nuclease with RNAse H fold